MGPSIARRMRTSPCRFTTRVWCSETLCAAQRLKTLAQSRGLSMNKLVEQLSAHALAAWDTENHFRAMAATGDVHKALAVLDRLDVQDAASNKH